MAAAVWGRMWRYAQMKDGVCRVSHHKLSEQLQVSRTTIIKHIEVLRKHGYLEDLTPGVVKSAHQYRVVVPTSGTKTVLDNAESSTESVPDENDNLVQNLYITSTESVPDGTKSSTESVHKETTTKRHSKIKDMTASSPKRKKPTGDPRVTELVLGFQELLGYDIPSWGIEAKAAKSILRSYSADDAYSCWRYMQTDSFWEGKHCGLVNVNKNLGPWIKAGRPVRGHNGRGKHAVNRRGGADYAKSEGSWTTADAIRIEREREAEEEQRA